MHTDSTIRSTFADMDQLWLPLRCEIRISGKAVGVISHRASVYSLYATELTWLKGSRLAPAKILTCDYNQVFVIRPRGRPSLKVVSASSRTVWIP